MTKDEPVGRPPPIERVRSRRAQHQEPHRLYRIAFAVVGFLVCLAGVVMLVFDQVTKGSHARRAALLAAGILAVVAIVVTVVFWDLPFFPAEARLR